MRIQHLTSTIAATVFMFKCVVSCRAFSRQLYRTSIFSSTSYASTYSGKRTILTFVTNNSNKNYPTSNIFSNTNFWTRNCRLKSSTSTTSSSLSSTTESTVSYLDNKMKVHHFPTLGSTQDEARKLLTRSPTNEDDSPSTTTLEPFAVSANEQTEGRGTSGRSWKGPRGNTFLTLAFPSDDLCILPTLLPLQVGNVVANRIQNVLEDNGSDEEVKLKWPNDLLVRSKKLAGILIESERRELDGSYWFLVGIGVNWKIAPTVEVEGKDRGRSTTCICDHCDCGEEVEDDARGLAFDIANDIFRWIDLQKVTSSSSSSERMNRDIVEEFERRMEWNKRQELRDVPGRESVYPVKLELDGRLRVRGSDGSERLLCTEYLF